MSSDATIRANIRRARTLGDIPAEHYLLPHRAIGQVLAAHAEHSGEREFLRYSNDDSGARACYSYAQFSARVNQLANLLVRQYGVQRGDRVATLAFNHPDAALLLFACWQIGATAVPQNMAEDDTRIAFVLGNADCKLAFALPDYAQRARALQAQVSCVQQMVIMDESYRLALDQQPEHFAAPADLLEQECLLLYTSGTTGAPKGVQLTQYNVLVNADSIRSWQRVDAETRMMCVLPIHHINGIVVTLLTPLLAGGSVLLLRGFKAQVFWRHIEEQQIAIVSVVPTLLQFLCEANAKVEPTQLRSLRHLICGAGTLAVALVERFERQFGVPIVHGYGLSETSGYSSNTPIDLTQDERRYWLRECGYASIGVAFGANELSIHDSEGRQLQAGEKGEIVIRGHNVMQGYFQRPDANAEAFKHGWFRSGDEGFYQLDAQGRRFFFITGRLKELINRGGVKYSPFDIEEVLLEIPGVKVGLAIGFDNDWYGEEVGAYVVAEPGAALAQEQILTYCRQRMPFAKSPKVVVFGDEIPVTATGKYQRLKLQSLFAQYRSTQFRADKK